MKYIIAYCILFHILFLNNMLLFNFEQYLRKIWCFLLIWKLQPISSSFVVWEWWIWPVIELFSALIGLTDLFSISCLKSLILPTPNFNGLRAHRKIMTVIFTENTACLFKKWQKKHHTSHPWVILIHGWIYWLFWVGSYWFSSQNHLNNLFMNQSLLNALTWLLQVFMDYNYDSSWSFLKLECKRKLKRGQIYDSESLFLKCLDGIIQGRRIIPESEVFHQTIS